MTSAVHTARPTDTWFDAAMDVIVVRASEPRLQSRADGRTRPAAFHMAGIGTADGHGISYG